MTEDAKVVIADYDFGDVDVERKILEAAGLRLVAIQAKSEDELIVEARDCNAVINQYAHVGAKTIAAMSHCRVIARYGVGYDNLDVEAATERGIAVVNVPDYCAEDVSDHALALFMACVRQVVLRDRELRKGKWNIKGGPIFRITGKTFGLIGYGNIPQTLHRKLAGFALARVLTFDPFIAKEVAEAKGAELVDLETLLRESDFVSVHAPLNDRTHHMLGKEQFKRMKREAILVNTSRGGVVDTAALSEAVKDGLIRAAGLDVHEQEPVPADYALCKLDNVILTDHIGSYSEESQIELQTKAAQAIASVLTGTLPKNVVNREALARARQSKDASRGGAGSFR